MTYNQGLAIARQHGLEAEFNHEIEHYNTSVAEALYEWDILPLEYYNELGF